MTTATCIWEHCPWTFTGTDDDAQREARRHTGQLVGGPGHPTNTMLAVTA